ncbi:efflux RND transporter permease subunit [Legionella sp. W05-934-2]|uniref:efflux RND transporter permease subunit n=1 Tax=Legionella sp. W05-934-2 TaxID=1198649 RepID=UPI003461C8FB
MDIASYSLSHRVVVWLLIVFLLWGGLSALQSLSRLEDPEFTIKEALVITAYPGATPKQVEEEVTDKITEAIQQMPQLKRTKSISRPGLSRITVTIKDKYTKKDLPQIWDELRRKVNDVQRSLPPGAGPSKVVDDYGDVYGMLYAITGDGFTQAELRDYAIAIKKKMLLVDGVAKVNLSSIEQEAIIIEIPQRKIASLGISLNTIYELLKSQNTIFEAGSIRISDEYIEILPSGSVNAVEDIGNLVIRSTKSNSLLHLNDFATIKRGYVEVPQELSYFNNQQAIMMGISVVSGGNVVDIGERVNDTLNTIFQNLPAGVHFHIVYDQPQIVDESVKGFLLNLLAALVIVMLVLIVFMGLQSGLIIAATLLLTVMGTLFFMSLLGISLERISLGALIIALGMLVDNAIVVTEGILVRTQRGISVLKASSEIVAQTRWPLLGATIVGIVAFAPIGLSQDNTGEYCASLFYVLLISLFLSWIVAILIVPLLSDYLFKVEKNTKLVDNELVKEYAWYRRMLHTCLIHAKATLTASVLLLGIAIIAFKWVPSGFFPNATTPMFYIDYWLAEGVDIRQVKDDLLQISQHLQTIEGIDDVTIVVGQGMQRFMLVYTPEAQNPSYGQLVIKVKDYHQIPALSAKAKDWINQHYPQSQGQVKFVRLGTSSGAKIEARFSGPDYETLRHLSSKAQAIFYANPQATDIRDDWRQKVKIITPQYSEDKGRLTGITRADLAQSLEMNFSGSQVGLYRERDQLLPIISRAPDEERLNINSLDEISLWSSLLNKPVFASQLIDNVNVAWQDNIIARRNRERTLTVSAEPVAGEASILFKQIKSQIEAIPLPHGYKLEWGGEYESAKDAQKGLAKNIPPGIAIMIAIVIVLYNAIRQPLVIWLCVPLAIIGVTFGLLITYKPFDFMGLLGFLSLTGMLIKNAIVLIDQIDLELTQDKELIPAILDASSSRLRPVSLAALTTVMGMIPLLTDAFFVSMAVVIIFGLTFATILTLIVVPVLYSVLFKQQSQ